MGSTPDARTCGNQAGDEGNQQKHCRSRHNDCQRSMVFDTTSYCPATAACAACEYLRMLVFFNVPSFPSTDMGTDSTLNDSKNICGAGEGLLELPNLPKSKPVGKVQNPQVFRVITPQQKPALFAAAA